MRLVFVTRNTHKFEEIEPIFRTRGIGILQHPAELEEPAFSSAVQILRHKARHAFAIVNKPVIVDDTGIYFSGTRNFPGLFPRRVFEQMGFKGLLARVQDVRRGMRFVTYLAYYDGKTFHAVRGTWNGTIAKRPTRPLAHDRGGFPYERIFIPRGMTHTLNRLRVEEKNAFSHRAKAAQKMAAWLLETNGKKEKAGGRATVRRTQRQKK